MVLEDIGFQKAGGLEIRICSKLGEFKPRILVYRGSILRQRDSAGSFAKQDLAALCP